MGKAVVFLFIGLLLLGLAAGTISFVQRSIRKAKGLSNLDNEQDKQPYIRPDGCCGRHAVCERDAVATQTRGRIVYFDDEELDAYRGTPPNKYPADAVDLFREVFRTMSPSEVPEWLRSLGRREIALPDALHDEVYNLLRAKANVSAASDTKDSDPIV